MAKLFTDEALIGYMLRFESALVQAQARHGVAPEAVASVIDACYKTENINTERNIKQMQVFV